MTAESKLEVLRAVEGAGLPVNQVLSQLSIAKSRVVKKLGPPVTAARLMVWKREWAAISADAEAGTIPGPCFSRAGCTALRLVTGR